MYHMIRYLAQRFPVDLVGTASSDAAQAEGVCGAWCREVELLPPSGPQGVLSRFRISPYGKDPRLAQRIQSRLSQQDYAVIHLEKPAMLPYLPVGLKIPLILDLWSYGLSGPWRAWRNQSGVVTRCRNLFQMTRLGIYDLLCWPPTSCLLVVSDHDRIRCERARPQRRVLVAPNGVDCQSVTARPHLTKGPPIILFSGDLSFSPNVDAAMLLATQMFPRIRLTCPEAQLYLVGRKPVACLQDLDGGAITITGEVPDMLPYLHSATVYVAPHFTGAGTRTKLLEAMAAGLPIVTTSVGIEGIQAIHQQHVLIADTIPDLCGEVERLLQDASAQLRLGSGARKLAENRYDWSKCLQPLDSLYASLLSRKVA